LGIFFKGVKDFYLLFGRWIDSGILKKKKNWR